MKPKVAVIFGGPSTEHEVSLQSATNIFNAIDRDLYQPLLTGVDKNGVWHINPDYIYGKIDLVNDDYFQDSLQVIPCKINGMASLFSVDQKVVLSIFDIAFPIIHGSFGEDGTLQGIFKYLEVPYVGPDVLGSSVCMDKDIAKRLLRDNDISIARYRIVYKHSPEAVSFSEASRYLGLPLFIKPANAGSSVGVSKVNTEEEYNKAIHEALKYDKKALIEEAITGKEIECAILGNEFPEASVVGEIVATKDFYSYDAKYISADSARLTIPADIDPIVADEIRQVAVKAYQTVGCEGMSRIDFFLREDNTYVLNEINTLPGFTKISMYPKMWEASGISYSDLITKLIKFGLERHKRDITMIKKFKN
jgi:D-alanine-D-alanine ligase